MTEVYKSIREFAQLANVSTDTVYRMIREGKIKQNESGKISVKYLQEFQSKAILDVLARTKVVSQLFVAVNAPDEIESNIDETKLAKNENIKRYDNIEDLLEAYREEQVSCAEKDSERLSVMYREHILREFITRYRNAAKYEIDKLYNHEVAGGYPLRVVYELALYGTLCNDSLMKAEDIDAGVSKYLNDKMSEAFERIIASLNLYRPDGQPLFTRTTITPEIISSLEGFNFREERDAVIKGFTAINFSFAKGTDSEKIWNAVLIKYTSTIKSKVAYNLLKDGFYSVINFKNTTTEESILKLSKAINQGYYKEVCILMTEDELKSTCFPLYLTLKTATELAHVKLIFAN